MAKKEVEGVNALTQFGGIPMQLAKPFIDKFLSSVLSEAEDINQGLVQLDASGKVLWANKSALAIAGLEAKDVVGKRYSLLKIFAKGFALKSLPRAISSTSKFKNTYYVPIISVGNGIRDVKAELFPMKSGKLMVGYLVLLSDITDDKIMAERLAESEQRSRLILDNSLDVICIYDTTGVIEYAAGALERHGYSSKDLIGKRIIDFIHPEDQSAALATFRSALRGKPLPVTCRLRKKKGQYFYAEERGQLIRSPGRPFKILSIIRDVTKEREALEKEREYQSRYTAIVDKTDLVIFSYRLDDLTLTFVSPNCTRVFGYVQRSLIGKKLLDFVHPDDKQLVIDTISKSVKTGIDSTSFCRIQRLDKTYRHCKISGTMNRGQSGKYEVVTGVITDINDIRTAEYELKHKLELETAEGKIFSAFLSHANDDDSIEKSLQELSKVFGADAGFTFNVDESGKKMSIGHYWYGFKGKFFGKYIHDVPLAKFPSLIRLIKSNKHFSVSDVNEMKGFAANEKAFAKMIGIGSFIVMPLWTHGKLMGFIGFTCRHKNEWNKDSILLLSRAASLMSGTLEKIKAEKALKDSEAELKSLFDSIDDFLFVVDMRGRIVKTNKVAESMLGYSGSELLKKSFLDLHPPYTRHQAQATVQDMIKGNKDYCDIPFMTKSGKLIQVETHVTQGLWGQEKVLIGISRDTTERLAAARALKESEERYELIVKNSRQIAYTLNFIKRSVTWSGAVKPLTGHDPKGFASLSLEIWQGMMHPFDKQRVEALFKHAFRTQGKYKTEYRLRKKDGRYIFVEDIGSYTQSGLLVGSMKDITDRKLAEDAVKKKLTFQTIVSKITSRFVDVADLDSSINESLADLGELTQADRAYLFLVDESGDYYRNANEWCNRGVASQKDKLQQVPASEIKWLGWP